MKTLVTALALSLFFSSCSSPARKPTLPFVIDSADVLTDNQKADLTNDYRNLDMKTHHKMGLLTIRNYKPEKSLSEFSRKYFENNKLDADTTHHTILIVFCTECHGVDIATGTRPDDRITKSKLNAIIDTVMIPQFKYDRHYAGLQKGSDAIFALLDTTLLKKP